MAGVERVLGRQYAAKTAGLSTADKQRALSKLTGRTYDPMAQTGGFDRRAQQERASLADMYTSPDRYGKGGGALKDVGARGQADYARQAEALKGQLTSKDYEQIVGEGAYSRSGLTADETAKQGDAGQDAYWGKFHNKLTGEDQIERDSDKKDPNTQGIGGVWRRNKESIITGGGAVVGGVLGSVIPGFGTAAGAAAGAAIAGGARRAYANSVDRKKAAKAQRDAAAQDQAFSTNRGDQFSDEARQRAAGAGTVGFTQRTQNY